jgi:hypothetical protein
MPASAPLSRLSTPATMASCRVRSSYWTSWPWSFWTLDSKPRLVRRSCSFSCFRRAISTGFTFLEKWNHEKRTAAAVSTKSMPAARPICRLVTCHFRSRA